MRSSATSKKPSPPSTRSRQRQVNNAPVTAAGTLKATGQEMKINNRRGMAELVAEQEKKGSSS